MKFQKSFIILIILTGILFSAFAFQKKKRKKREPQYKKQNRDQITQIAKGNPDKAISHFQKYLKGDAKDLESWYGIALAEQAKGNNKAAVKAALTAIELGLPVDRFAAGPRNLTKEIFNSPKISKLLKSELLHGPFIGHTTFSSTKIWVRTLKESTIKIEVSEKEDFSAIASTGTATSKASDDFTAKVDIKNLKENTTYFYRISIDKKEIKDIGKLTFKTFPEKGGFRIAFGGGAGYTPKYEKVWNIIEKHNPNTLFLLGDNVYIDTPETPETQYYCYYRRQSRKEFKSLTSKTPTYMVYDDHDFGDNDSFGTNHKDSPAWKRPVLKIFSENSANPSYGGGKEDPGCWFKIKISDAEFFFMDTRYYRDNPRTKQANKTMLGEVQRKWLLKSLKESKAKFKVICSTVPMTKGVKPGKVGVDTGDG